MIEFRCPGIRNGRLCHALLARFTLAAWAMIDDKRTVEVYCGKCKLRYIIDGSAPLAGLATQASGGFLHAAMRRVG